MVRFKAAVKCSTQGIYTYGVSNGYPGYFADFTNYFVAKNRTDLMKREQSLVKKVKHRTVSRKRSAALELIPDNMQSLHVECVTPGLLFTHLSFAFGHEFVVSSHAFGPYREGYLSLVVKFDELS